MMNLSGINSQKQDFYGFTSSKNISLANTNVTAFTSSKKANLTPANYKAYFMAKIHFDGKLLKHDQREWMESNGGGAYGSSTVSGAETRNYHGLLIGALNQPVDRNVMLTRIDEEVDIKGQNSSLSEAVYGDWNPRRGGDSGKEESNIKSFSVLPVPTWEYDLGDNKSLTKQVALPNDKGKGTVVVGYTYNAPADAPEITLTLRPILNFRNFHTNQNSVSGWNQRVADNKLMVDCGFHGTDARCPINLAWDKKDASYQTLNNYYGNFFHVREAERGCGSKENGLYNPGAVKVTLKPGESFSLTTSAESDVKARDIKTVVDEKAERLEKLYNQSGLPKTESFKLLQRAADQFVVHRNSVNGPTILAGYHWFNDWGRDTMISLPGCTLTTKRLDDAKGILETFAKYVRNGMLPNNFPDAAGHDPGYNTSDASMWWFNALNSYIDESKKVGSVDREFVKQQYNALKQVVKHHMYGRHNGNDLTNSNPALAALVDKGQGQLPVGNGGNGLGMESDGLIAANDGQLTWMDAAINGQPMTPREGKAVEINALWYNGLCIMKDLAAKFGEPEEAEKFGKLANLVKDSMKQFWNPETKSLYDLIGLHRGQFTTDGSIRSNQIIALALPNRPFKDVVMDGVKVEDSTLQVVQDKLLTPYGLRSLAPGHDKYAPHYPNYVTPNQRDAVYHQGTVWGWKMGPFADAYLNVKGADKKETREQVYDFVKPMLDHLKGKVDAHAESGGCVGGIAEIFDATAPFSSKGTVNQAWSVAEVLRVMEKIQDVAVEREKV